MISFILYLVLILLGLIIPRSRIIFYIQWLYFSIAICFNIGGPDVETYRAMYENIFSRNVSTFFSPESIYGNLAFLFGNILDINFFTFTIITSMLGMIAIGFLINNSMSPAIIMSFIMIYPGFDLIIQKRNFLGMVFLLLGLYFLFNLSRFRNVIYILFIFIAAGFHYIFLIYLIFPFILTRNISSVRKLAVFYMLILPLTIFLIPHLMSAIIPVSKFELYFNKVGEEFHISRSLFFLFIHVFFVFLCLRALKLQAKEHIYDFGFKLLCFSLIATPFYFYDSTFFRIYRNLLPFIYFLIFYCDMFLINLKLKLNKRYFLFFITILSQSLIFYTSGHGWEYNVKPLFSENTIFMLINI